MITLTQPKTTAETNIANLQDILQRISNRNNANIQDLNESRSTLWNLPTQELLDVLNYLGPIKLNGIFTAHEKYGTFFNEIQDDMSESGVRAIIGRGRYDIVMNDSGVFELYVEPVVIAQEIIEEHVNIPEEEIIPETPVIIEETPVETTQ